MSIAFIERTHFTLIWNQIFYPIFCFLGLLLLQLQALSLRCNPQFKTTDNGTQEGITRKHFPYFFLCGTIKNCDGQAAPYEIQNFTLCYTIRNMSETN